MFYANAYTLTEQLPRTFNKSCLHFTDRYGTLPGVLVEMGYNNFSFKINICAL